MDELALSRALNALIVERTEELQLEVPKELSKRWIELKKKGLTFEDFVIAMISEVKATIQLDQEIRHLMENLEEPDGP